MAKLFRLKNGHTLDLGQGREPITGLITEERYDALLKISPNFEKEFEEVEVQDKKVKPKNDEPA